MRFGLVVGMVGSLVSSAAVAGAGYYGWELYQAGSLDKRFAAFQSFEQALDIEFKYDRDRIKGEAFTPGFALEKVVIISDDKQIPVERVEFRRFDWKQPQRPHFANIALTGMQMKASVLGSMLGPDLGKALADPSLDTVTVDVVLDFEAEEEEVEDPKTKRKVKQKKVTIKTLSIAVRDLATITATIDLKDFDVVARAVARAARQYPPLVRLLGERVQLAGMRVVFDDKGLMRKIMEAKSQELGKGELQARGAYVRELQRDAQATRSAVGSNRFDADYFRPMIAYVERYDTRAGFTLTATPPKPIEIRRLFIMWDANRGGFFQSLGPKITVGAAVRRAEPKKDEKRKEEPKKKEEPKRRP
ncbi:MAG: hypothetical protein KIT16_04115 [Rhodospirillaceae bacterium]|nr:hypothetical protein [Rhodospirillaceae bacterium]